jgi:hypothetical protein
MLNYNALKLTWCGAAYPCLICINLYSFEHVFLS